MHWRGLEIYIGSSGLDWIEFGLSSISCIKFKISNFTELGDRFLDNPQSNAEFNVVFPPASLSYF